MRRLLIGLILFLYFVFAHAQTCQPLDSSTTPECYNVYKLFHMEAFVPAGQTLSDLENLIDNLKLPLLESANPPQTCLQAALYFACPGVFKNCTVVNGTPVGTPVCKSACIEFTNNCTDFLSSLSVPSGGNGTQFLPNCDANDPTTNQPYPTSNCVDLAAGGLVLPQNNFSCTPPLIPNPSPNQTHQSCVGACCLPCPPTQYFYLEGQFDTVDKTCFGAAIISLFCSLALALSYSVLPHKRGYPSHIILNIGIALTIFYITIFFNATPEWFNKTRCNNSIDMALPGMANSYAIAQSAFVIYGILTAAIWYGFLVLNIFMSVVFLSTRLGDFPLVYHLINWGLPWISVIVALASNESGYLGLSTWIITNNGYWLDGLVMIPMALIIFPSVILNVITLVRITMIGLRRNANWRQIVRLQLRPFLFVLVVLTFFLIYWIHYEVALRVSPPLNWLPDWFQCIQKGGGQNYCAQISLPYMPNYHAYFFSEFIVNCIGIVLWAFFGLKRDVIFGWYYYLTKGKDASFFMLSVTGGGSKGATSQIRSMGESQNEMKTVRSSSKPDVISKAEDE